jgi:arylsulfatase
MYGCDAVPTPNLDRLARTGVVFDNAITQSTVCAPARASMMTGRYVSDHMVWTNDVPFRDGVEYLPVRMNELGYTTGAFGKLHHYPASDGKGFRRLSLMEEGRLGEDEPYLTWLRERHPDVERIWNHDGLAFAFDEHEYYEHWIASEAMQFITDAVENSEPFLAWISFQGPHGPVDPPRQAKGLVDPKKLPTVIERRKSSSPPPEVVTYRAVLDQVPASAEENLALRTAYAEQIVSIDRQVGRLIERLEGLGVLEDTSVIFSADHGDMIGDLGLNAKGPFPYPAQMDIPLVLSNHPGVDRGTRSKTLVGNIDIPGTVLDIAGSDRPIGYSRSLVGMAAAGSPQGSLREAIYSEFCDSVKTVDNGRYRYSYYPFQGTAELYDKSADPHFLENLSGSLEHAEVEKTMLQHIVDFLIMSKGVRVEAHDFVPAQQRGLRRKFADYQRGFPVAFPLSRGAQEKLGAAGCDTHYNDFCKEHDIARYYEKPFWME